MDQAGPSTAPSNRSRQYASFIFDPSIPRNRYTELSQRNGVVHSLVKRLMEKHSSEDNELLLDAVVTPTLPYTAHKRQKGRERLDGFTTPTAFLGRLPSLREKFGEASGYQVGDAVVWPAFGQESVTRRGGKKRKRREEVGLMAGVATGIEDINIAAQFSQAGPIPSILTSSCPPDARPLLESLYTPPSTSTSSPSSSRMTKYIFIFAYISPTSPVEGKEGVNEWKPKVSDCCREAEWGEADWDEIGLKCGDLGVEVSLVLLGSDTGDRVGRLKDFVQTLNPNPPTPAWFPLPPETFTHFTSLSLSATTGHPPSSTQSTSSTILQTPSSDIQPTLQPTQAMAMRFLAQRGMTPNSSSPGVSAALQSFLAAAKNGNVDPNDPQMAHFKQMIMMQQQAAQAQTKAQGGNQGQNQSQEDQLSVAASVQRQKAVQAMQAVRMQQEQAQGRPNTQAPNTAAGASGGAKMKVWSGDIVWPTQGSSGGIARLSVECTAVNNGNIADTTQIGALIPPELRIISSMQADINFLQAFVREHKVPVLQFSLNSEYNTADPSHVKRFESLITGLSSKGTAGVVHIGGSDRGMLLCTAPGGNGQLPRLLGVLCLSIPLPTSFTRQPTNPTPQPTSIQAPRSVPNPPPSQRQPSNGPPDLPAPYNPTPSQQPIAMANINPIQLKMLIEQAIKVGIEVPSNINPTQITQDQLKGLINSIRLKGAQSRQMQSQQQQQQQMGGGGVDPRLMAGASVDPRLMQTLGQGQDPGTQAGLAQMQMQMVANISRGGEGNVGANQGYQYR